jgi:hypothetical protein
MCHPSTKLCKLPSIQHPAIQKYGFSLQRLSGHTFFCLPLHFLKQKKNIQRIFQAQTSKGRKSKKESVVLNLNMIA